MIAKITISFANIKHVLEMMDENWDSEQWTTDSFYTSR